jgi:hypothetical protein
VGREEKLEEGDGSGEGREEEEQEEEDDGRTTRGKVSGWVGGWVGCEVVRGRAERIVASSAAALACVRVCAPPP